MFYHQQATTNCQKCKDKSKQTCTYIVDKDTGKGSFLCASCAPVGDCAYCDLDYSYPDGEAINIEEAKTGEKLLVYVNKKNQIVYDMLISYCPCCGRKL